ncbi:MAG: preprotein translocase subunit SecG [Pirellulales bacterium]|nr:preprotein translocase subunit SecG [Pirellulales bacterium]
MNVLLGILMVLTAVFLVLLVLVQRGRGGGLAGALGGMGGQSAFGTKAGDLFTRVTIWTAAFWIFLLILSVKVMSGGGSKVATGGSSATTSPSNSESGLETKPGDKSSLSKESAGSGAAASPANDSGSAAPAKTADDVPATGGTRPDGEATSTTDKK